MCICIYIYVHTHVTVYTLKSYTFLDVKCIFKRGKILNNEQQRISMNFEACLMFRSQEIKKNIRLSVILLLILVKHENKKMGWM